jgi:site-specific DNA recombinase
MRGYSGASLIRPGLAAEGHIEAVLIHSPDRLSRKYAYQAVWAEEFSKHGVELRFVKSPSVITPEDQLLVQFQGMIAEYERAQILERSRRGKRHRPRGLDQCALRSAARLSIHEEERLDGGLLRSDGTEAEVVRLVFQTYIE